MIDRIISAFILVGACVLAVFLFQRHFAAPSCHDDAVTAQVANQVSADFGRSGYNITDVKETRGGFFSRIRQCQMDVAPIVGLQEIDKAHWTRVTYTDSRKGNGDAVTVNAHVVGPSTAHFKAG